MNISVIIPVYNVEKYLRRCLLSVIDQDIDGFNIECIVVDDCATDNSMGIVEDIINNYHGSEITFRIIRHHVNRGLSAARNTGIMASTSDFLFFIDSDDDIMENTFKCFYSYLQEYPFVDVIMGNNFGIEEKYLSNSSFAYNITPYLINDKLTIINHVLRRSIDRHAWNKLIRRSLVMDNNLFFDEGLLYEDVTWTYRLYSTISSILVLPELTYIYEYNPTSIVHTLAERSRKIVWSFVFISDFLLNNPPVINNKKVFFTEHCLFVNHWMLFAIDLYEKYGAEDITRVKLNTLKRNLLWKSVCHLRPVLALYFLTMFKPFCLLLKLRVFRTNIDRIIHVVYKMS